MGNWGNNLSALPFYESLEEQDFRKWYAYGENYRLVAKSTTILPFFFAIPYDAQVYTYLTNGTLPTISIMKVCSTCEIPQTDPNLRGSFSMDFSESFHRYDSGGLDFYSRFSQNGFSWYATGTTADDWIVFFYPADEVVNMGLESGLYYLSFNLHIEIPVPSPPPPAPVNPPIIIDINRYSDIFTIADTSMMTKLSWSFKSRLEMGTLACPSEDDDSFVNVVYLDTEIGMPEYESTEEGEDRNGYFFPIKQLSQKTHRMNFIAPEYLCDALRVVFMADTITVVDRLQKTYDCTEFHNEVNWLEQGHYAEVRCNFQTDLVVKKIGKAY